MTQWLRSVNWRQVAWTVAAFLVGYGGVQIATGYRYVALHWDWQALIAGLITSGLYHMPSMSNGNNAKGETK